MKEKSNENSEKFSDDPEENLRIENEILKLKLQAETGALFGGSDNLPPEIEHSFLQNVQQFENAWKDLKQVKVYDLLKKPSYKKLEELAAADIEPELKKLFDLLEKNNMPLAVFGEYEPEIIYKFITEELFEHETDDIQLPGMIKNFTYEEFHPNHKMDIHARAMEFLSDWFEQKFTEHSWELGDPFIVSNGTILPKQEVLKKINNVFESYSSFPNAKFFIAETSFQWDDERQSGLGFAEGGAAYDAVMENGETIHFQGPFKLYMSNEGGWWSIIYFIFPGFSWDEL